MNAAGAQLPEILRRHRLYGVPATVGEWADIGKISRADYHAVLDSGETDTLATLFNTMFGRPMIAGLVGFGLADLAEPVGYDRIGRDMRENLTLWRGFTDGDGAEHLSNTDAGSPLRFIVGPHSMLYDTPRHDHYAHRILQVAGSGVRVLEIGGGYGGMANQLLRRSPAARTVLVDLPTTLYMAAWWLTMEGQRVGWYDTDPDAPVVLLPAHALGEWDHSADLVFSAHSLGEMDAATVGRYMGWLRARRVPWFYHDNAHLHDLPAPGPTAGMFPELTALDYRPDGYDEVYRAPALWANTGNRYFEFLYHRRGAA